VLKVIIAGRTESKLRTTAHKIGYYVIRPSQQDPVVCDILAAKHPELNCLINNAVQRLKKKMEKNSAGNKGLG
jgi:short-subunit dehydrogenase involved in D-alanine esterification of teichoic acids